MTAHIISHGIQPSLHPGVLRKIGSIVIRQAPLPVTAEAVFACIRLTRGAAPEHVKREASRQAGGLAG